MCRIHVGVRFAVAAVAAASLALAAATPVAQAQNPAEPDCVGPAGDPAPGTPEWDRREDDNVYCATQRNEDHASNPAYQAALAQPPVSGRSFQGMDPFREPTLWAGSRFRFEEVSFHDAAGQSIPGLLFRPCDPSCSGRPAGVQAPAPPYPGVVIVHGGAASQEMYLWAAEGLAEAGYMVLTFSIGRTADTHYEDTKAALDYLFSTPDRPSPAGQVNPRWAELDRARIGLAGHSGGGVAVSRLGQEDPRVSAVVSWDRAQSGPMPADLRLRTPALFVVADFNCQRVPVCLPERRETPPDPHGPGNKDEDFQRVSAAGVDTMKIALRATPHLTFTEFPQANGSRYGNVTAFYYTLAWLDRYVAGGPGRVDDALRRLTATTFDDSSDLHNVSGGTWDPSTGQNVPAHIAGQPVADRLSFHFRSAYFLEGGRRRCESMRGGCPPLRVQAATCLPRSSSVGRRGIGAVRLRLTRADLAVRAPAPRRRGARAWRWCVEGSGGGSVRGAFSAKGRLLLLASTAHARRGVRRGVTLRAARRSYPHMRTLRRGLLRAGAGSRMVIGVKRGRVRFVAVASIGLIRRPRTLARYLRYAGLA